MIHMHFSEICKFVYLDLFVKVYKNLQRIYFCSCRLTYIQNKCWEQCFNRKKYFHKVAKILQITYVGNNSLLIHRLKQLSTILQINQIPEPKMLLKGACPFCFMISVRRTWRVVEQKRKKWSGPIFHHHPLSLLLSGTDHIPDLTAARWRTDHLSSPFF